MKPSISFRLRPLAIAIHAALVCVAGQLPAHAAETGGSTASAVASRHYDIPAGPLAEVLSRFAGAADVTLVFDAAQLAGLRSSGLRGSYSVREGFSRLLAGSGYETVDAGSGRWSLRRAASEGITLASVTVTADAERRAGELPPAYAGGQVARGGRLGVLGNVDIMDAPFSVSSYTAELIENQQARSLAEVMQNDSSVRSVFAQGSGIDQLYIRGFLSANQDTAFDGQFGIAPSASGILAVEMYERVEVLKGASTFLYGIAPSGSAGGIINVVPKRAGEAPVTRLNASAGSDSMLGVHADIGRRFGPGGMFGIRVNALRRKGKAAWKDNERDTTLGSVALDLRTQKLRASVDLGYQEQRSEVMPVSIRLGAGVPIPAPPKPGESYGQRWTFNESQNRFAAVRGEFDATPTLQLYGSYGWNALFNEVLSSYPTVTDAATGAIRESAPFHSNTHTERNSAEVGLRTWFATGPVQHAVTLSANAYRQETGLAREAPLAWAFSSNLYDPLPVPRPAISHFPEKPPKTDESRFSGMALADTLSLFDERLKITLGARNQKIENSTFNATTGARTARYDKSAVTPFFAVVAKPRQHLSIYANYIEALSQGPQAPLGAVNVGEVFAPIKSKQHEIGAKADFGRYAVTASLFQITRPSAATDPNTNRYGLIGEQRNRGIEINVFGEPVAGIRVLGGLTWLDGVLSKTAGGANDGRTAPGVPDWQANLGGEWDVAGVPGLTLNARVIHTSSQYYDQNNVRGIPGWTRFDMGARYVVQGPYPVTLRVAVENVADKRYWASAVGTFGSELNAGAPRTLQLSASLAF